MDTLPNGEPSEQPVAAPATPPAGEQPLQGDVASELDGLSSEQLFEVLETANSGEAPRQVEAPASPAAEAESESPPQAEQPNGEEHEEESEAPPVAGDETQQPHRPKQRLSVRSLPPEQQSQLAAAVELVRDGKATDIASALAQVTGATATTAAEAPPTSDGTAEDAAPSQVAPPAPSPGNVDGIKNRIKELREQRRQAIGDFDRDTEAQITDEIEDLQLELVRAEQSAQVQQVEARSYNASFAKAVDTVEAKYEAAKDDSSAFTRILDDKVAAAHARNDPSLKDPNYIIRFADEVAADLGLNKGTPPPPAPARPARPVGSFASGHSTSQRLSPEAARKLLNEAPIEALQAVAFTE